MSPLALVSPARSAFCDFTKGQAGGRSQVRGRALSAACCSTTPWPGGAGPTAQVGAGGEALVALSEGFAERPGRPARLGVPRELRTDRLSLPVRNGEWPLRPSNTPATSPLRPTTTLASQPHNRAWPTRTASSRRPMAMVQTAAGQKLAARAQLLISTEAGPNRGSLLSEVFSAQPAHGKRRL